MKWKLWQFDEHGFPTRNWPEAELEDAIDTAVAEYPELDSIRADLSRVGGRYAELPYGCFVLAPVEA